MNAFRVHSILSPSLLNSCRLIGKRLISRNDTNTLQSVVNSKNAKRRSRPLLRKYLIPTSLLLGSGNLYYFYYLTPKERRQIKVIFQGLQRAFRSFQIGFMITLDYKYLFWTVPDNTPEYHIELKECHKRSANRIAQGCIENGGLYVKLGQGMVSADQVLPVEYTNGLRVLQDKALRRQRNEINQLIDEEFGCQISDIFSYLSPEPIAAASLAEVYEGRLKETNERVAVKLQYIDLQDRFAGDMLTVRLILYIVSKIFPKFEFSWMIDSVKSNLERELDFKLEGENAERCYSQLSPHLNFIYVPKIYWKYTTKRILIMEYIDGIKVTDTEKLKQSNLSLKEIDTKLVQAMAFQIFHSGFVHADPHSGNVYVRKDPKIPTKSNVQIVLLDHGLYVTIDSKDREALCQLWKAIILKDETKMKHYANALGVNEKDYLTFAAVLCMRPIHRPIHDMAVFPREWDRMSPEDQEAARAQGKLRVPTEAEFLNMSSQDKMAMRKDFSTIFNDIQDSVLRTLHDMPRPVFMILRNLNLIRSTIRDHGNLIDRHTIMARSAILGARKYERPQRLLKDRIRARLELFLFDMILLKDQMGRWLRFRFLKVLVFFGYMSKETREIIETFQ